VNPLSGTPPFMITGYSGGMGAGGLERSGAVEGSANVGVEVMLGPGIFSFDWFVATASGGAVPSIFSFNACRIVMARSAD
jgi:hypothetical protein